MKKLLIFLVVFEVTCPAFSYPITPRPLRKLILESELIVHGRVIKLGSQKSRKDEHWNNDYAIIAIYETWKGNCNARTVKVYYTAGLICPWPPIFIEDGEVFAFLDKQKEPAEGYEVHALSYGLKNLLCNEESAAYTARIKEMLDIQQLPEGRETEEKVLDWLVTCAVNKYTRWEGMYELSPESDFMSYYDRDEPTRKEIFLSSNQRGRIYSALMAVDSIQSHDVAMVDIVMGSNDKDLLLFLKSRLLRIKDDDVFTASFVMDRIVKLTADKELEKILSEFNDDMYSMEKTKQLKTRARFIEFKQKMENATLKENVKAIGSSNS